MSIFNKTLTTQYMKKTNQIRSLLYGIALCLFLPVDPGFQARAAGKPGLPAKDTGSGPEWVQQNHTLSGRVTDTHGQPLPGVTVLVKGTFTGTTTGADGRYSLTSVPSGAVLSFSFVGFKTQEIPFDGLTRLDVQLQEDVTPFRR
ncbi:MAG: carboxypeptidase-like regulatory domain-containing protein [Mangrovibacterium sp.]